MQTPDAARPSPSSPDWANASDQVSLVRFGARFISPATTRFATICSHSGYCNRGECGIQGCDAAASIPLASMPISGGGWCGLPDRQPGRGAEEQQRRPDSRDMCDYRCHWEGGCHLLISHTFATDTYFEVSDPPSISGQADETPLVVISPGELLRDAHQIKVVSWSGAAVDSFGVLTSPQRASSDLGIGR